MISFTEKETQSPRLDSVKNCHNLACDFMNPSQRYPSISASQAIIFFPFIYWGDGEKGWVGGDRGENAPGGTQELFLVQGSGVNPIDAQNNTCGLGT